MTIRFLIFVAEEKGFEPLHPVTGLRAFQARPFNHLGIPPFGLIADYDYSKVIIVNKQKNIKYRFYFKIYYFIIIVMKQYVVSLQDEGITLEKYVRRVLKHAPLSFIYKLFRKKDVRVNNVKSDLKTKLHSQDIVSIYISDQQYDDFQNIDTMPASNQIKKYIVYEDENILIINKPAGMLVQKDINNSKSLDQLVKSYYFYTHPNCDKSSFTIAPAHRLDRNTSGLIIFGKSVSVMQQLMKILKDHKEIEKHYLTIVKGKINNGGRIDKPLKKNEKTSLVSVAELKDGAKIAITDYTPVQSYGDFTMLNVNLITGRTHQIRAHTKAINHPIVGDPKYGDFTLNKKIKELIGIEHQILHSYQIQFKIKEGNLTYLNDLVIKCPLDLKLIEKIEQLKNIKL